MVADRSKRIITVADLFCGAGGTSTGAIEALEAMGYEVRLTACNHWEQAIETHKLNHPNSRHYQESIDDLNPNHLFSPGELDILWASPTCTHFSSALGGKPMNEQTRATGWCVVRWAEALLPPVILVENVPEYLSWGPVGCNGRPLKSKKGATFQAWVGALESLGYRVSYRVLKAADFGDPTTRRRLFVQAVRGRRKIMWPKPTHAENPGLDMFGPARGWVPARGIIDWSSSGKSIYARKKPLSPKTIRRIEAGLKKFGLKPFIVPQQSNPAPKGIDQSIRTVVAEGSGPKLLEPYLIELRGTSAGQISSTAKSLDRPVGAITAGGIHHAVAEPVLLDADGSEVCASVSTVFEPHMLPQSSGANSRPVSYPAPTVATAGAIGLVEPVLLTPSGVLSNRPQVVIEGKTYELDIRYRMLKTRELARAQGFRDDYEFTGTKGDAIRMIGNAVPRRLARSIVAAVASQCDDVDWVWNHFEVGETPAAA